MVFLPKEQGARLACERAIERAIIEEGQILLGWRDLHFIENLNLWELKV